MLGSEPLGCRRATCVCVTSNGGQAVTALKPTARLQLAAAEGGPGTGL